MAEAMGRELEVLASHSNLGPTDDFTDRVMASIAAEPSPQPVAAFGTAIRTGRLWVAFAAIGDAWRVAFGSSRPAALRMQALALVLVVAVVGVGVGSAAVTGAGALLGPSRTPEPSLLPSPSPSPIPSTSPTPSPSPSTVRRRLRRPRRPRPPSRPSRRRPPSRPRRRSRPTTTAAATQVRAAARLRVGERLRIRVGLGLGLRLRVIGLRLGEQPRLRRLARQIASHGARRHQKIVRAAALVLDARCLARQLWETVGNPGACRPRGRTSQVQSARLSATSHRRRPSHHPSRSAAARSGPRRTRAATARASSSSRSSFPLMFLMLLGIVDLAPHLHDDGARRVRRAGGRRLRHIRIPEVGRRARPVPRRRAPRPR